MIRIKCPPKTVWTGCWDYQNNKIYVADIVQFGESNPTTTKITWSDNKYEIVFVTNTGGFFCKDVNKDWKEFIDNDVNTYEECQGRLVISDEDPVRII